MQWNPAAGDLFPGSLAASIGGAVWAWGLAALLGAALVPLAGERGRGRILDWLVIGIAAESLLWLGLSSVGRLWPLDVVVGASVLTAACLLVSGKRVLAAIADRETEARASGASWLARASIAIVVVVVALAFKLALFPTVFYDDLVFHVAAPRQALLTGSWPAMPGLSHTFMPAGWDATYLLPLALGGGSGPQLMNTCLLYTSPSPR